MIGTDSEHFSLLLLRGGGEPPDGTGAAAGTGTMAFCSNCGTSVSNTDAFCGGCGARQAGPAGPAGPAAGAQPAGPGPAQGAPAANPLDAMTPRTAGMLCYVPVLGIVMSIIVLAAGRFRRDVTTRFHAFQGLFLFVAYQVADKVLQPLFHRSAFGFNPFGLLKSAILLGSIYLVFVTRNGQKIKLPVVGDLAEKSAAEQG